MNDRPTAADLAGHSNEFTAWRLVKEVSAQILECKQFIVNPFIIEITENGGFNLTKTETQTIGFDAPETKDIKRTEANAAWSLGATAFFIVMGRQVMNGKGGMGQSETSKLPYLRSEWPVLSELVQQCLQFTPEKRPDMKNIHAKATQQFERCANEIKRGPRFKSSTSSLDDALTFDQELAFWPETMQAKHFSDQPNRQ